MEGYLNKKGRGEGNFGRRTWKKRWFVLEDQALTYYDELDMNSGFPSHLKGTIQLAGAVCSVYTHHEKKHTFVIKSETETDCILQAPDTRLMNLWIQEINKAARGESLIEKPDYPALYELLGLDINDQPDAAEINRAYRKKALRCHPDKGGDMLEFKQLQDAFNRINAKLDEDERLSHFNIFTFECVLMKNPGEVALGLSVREEAETRRILIKEVMDGVTIVRLSPQAGGVILPEDWLVKVRDEDVRGMPLLRVAQKLNDFRVPVNSNVKLTFERRVPKTDADYEQDPQHDQQQQQQDYYPAEAFQNFATQSTSQYVPTGGTHTDMEFDIDETTPEERAAAAAASAANSPSASAKSPSFVPRPPSQSTAAAAPPPQFNGSASHLDPVAYVSAMAENEELRADVDAKDRLLAEQAAIQAQLEAKLQQMSKALQQAQTQERHTQEQLLDSQLRHRMTKEQMQASIQSIAETSKRFVAAQQQQQATNKSVAEVMLEDTSAVPSKTQRLIERVFQHETWQSHQASTSDASSPIVDVSAAKAAVVTSLLLDVNGTFGGRFAGGASSHTPGGGFTGVLGRFESLLHESSSSQPTATAYPQDDFLMDDFQQPPASSSGNAGGTTGMALSLNELQQLFVQPNFITSQTPVVGQPQYAPPAVSNTRPPPVSSSGGDFGDFDDFGMGSPPSSTGAPAYGAPSTNAGYGNDFLDDFGGMNMSSPTPQQSTGRGYNANNSDNHSLMGSVMSSPSQAGSSGVPRVQIPGSVPRPSIGIGHAPSSNANANVPSYAQPKNVRSSVTSASSAQAPAPAAVGFTSPGLVRRRTQQFLNGGGQGASSGGDGMDFQ